MISLRRDGGNQREGYFKSYKEIGEYLSRHGETGDYWAIPKNIKSIAGMKQIHVVKMNKKDREIVMDGSYY